MKRRRTRYLSPGVFDKCARFIIKARRERRYFQKLAQGEMQGALGGTQGQTSPLPAQANQVGVQAPSVQNKSEEDTRIINEVVGREFNRWSGAISQVEKALQGEISYTDIGSEAKEILEDLERVKRHDLLRWNEARINQIKMALQKVGRREALTEEEEEALDDFDAVRSVLKMALLRKFERTRSQNPEGATDLIKRIAAIVSNEPIELTEEDFRDIKAAISDLWGETPQEWIQKPPVKEAEAPTSPEEKKDLFTLFSNMSPLAKLAVFSGVPLMLAGLIQVVSGRGGTLATGLGAILFALGVVGPEKLFGSSKTASRYFRSHLFV
jgi:hypothetical protein